MPPELRCAMINLLDGLNEPQKEAVLAEQTLSIMKKLFKAISANSKLLGPMLSEMPWPTTCLEYMRWHKSNESL